MGYSLGVNDGKYNPICSRFTLAIGLYEWGTVPASATNEVVEDWEIRPLDDITAEVLDICLDDCRCLPGRACGEHNACCSW